MTFYNKYYSFTVKIQGKEKCIASHPLFTIYHWSHSGPPQTTFCISPLKCEPWPRSWTTTKLSAPMFEKRHKSALLDAPMVDKALSGVLPVPFLIPGALFYCLRPCPINTLSPPLWKVQIFMARRLFLSRITTTLIYLLLYLFFSQMKQLPHLCRETTMVVRSVNHQTASPRRQPSESDRGEVFESSGRKQNCEGVIMWILLVLLQM